MIGVLPVRALVFDFDGLLVDTETSALRAWERVLAKAKSFDKVSTEQLTDAFRRIIGDDEDSVVGPDLRAEGGEDARTAPGGRRTMLRPARPSMALFQEWPGEAS